MARHPELALGLLRLMLGALFLVHGAQAIFVSGLGPFTAQFRGWGVPLPLLSAPLVATLELAGGALLVLGLGTRPVAGALALVLGGAVYFAHRGQTLSGSAGAGLPDGVLPLVLLVVALALVLGGPGRPSVDHHREGGPARPAAPRSRKG